jgi:hypothetical protein
MRTPSNALLMEVPAGKLKKWLFAHGLNHGPGLLCPFNPYGNHCSSGVSVRFGLGCIALRGKLHLKLRQAFFQVAFLGKAGGFVADHRHDGRYLVVRGM